ncbi:MAG: helix-turn-helix transcriptional regulator [Anaerolineaceae bacterium]|nr:helix-turn-helix transcriptional regulator [Anaerolineaceae bacterium]
MTENELLLLGVLKRQSMHGYQLADFIENNLDACTDLKKSNAYFLLEKMEQSGWVESQLAQTGKRPQRKVYRITPAGEEIFSKLLRKNLSEYSSAIFPADTGLAFLDEISTVEALGLLLLRKEAIKNRLDELTSIPEHPGTLQWLLEHQRLFLGTELIWIDELISRTQSKIKLQNKDLSE